MTLKNFLKQKFLFISLDIAFCIFTFIFLSVLNINSYAIFFLLTLYIFTIVFSVSIEYISKKQYYNTLLKYLDKLDKKHMLAELIYEPSFIEGQILYECLKQCNKSMNDEISIYKNASKEYREYIEMWIHEVKTPIASSKLIIENNKSEITKNLDEELNIIDYYLEQALFYSRSNSVEKDYIIKKIDLESLINSCIKKQAKSFIRKKIKLIKKISPCFIYTDTKWADFIITQILVNSIKYTTSTNSSNYFIQSSLPEKDFIDEDKALDATITIINQEYENSVALFISDNGIGISEKDLPKIFEKGYTGNTGRNYSKSTGMGLYLCKKLCDKLGLSINISSVESEGTEVIIVFPKTNFLDEISS